MIRQIETVDRINSLVAVFARRSPLKELNLRALSKESGKSSFFLNPTYPAQRSTESVAAVGKAAGRLLVKAGLLSVEDAPAVERYVLGDDEPLIEDLIGRELGRRRCKDCLGQFAEKEFMRPAGRCFACYRQLHGSEGIAEWLASVDQRIDAAPLKLREVWTAARADLSKAVTYRRLADLAGLHLEEFRRQWEAAGLPKRPGGRPKKAPPSGVGALLAVLVFAGALTGEDGRTAQATQSAISCLARRGWTSW